MDLVFADCQVVTSDSVFTGWVGVRQGRIAAMGRDRPPEAVRVIDGHGLHLLPGRVEPHCHLRAGNFQEELAEASRQAVAGGVTTLMPYMRAAESYLGLVPAWSKAVEQHSFCDVAFHLQIQIPAHLDEIEACHDSFGIQSFKVHIDSRRNPNFGLIPVDDGDVYLAMLAVREFDGIVAIHCENSEITRYLDQRIRASGRMGLAAWAEVRPPIAEAADVNNVVFLAAQLGCRVLIVHVSSSDSIAAANLHRHGGTIVETLIHQLAITDDDAQSRIGAAGKTNPPMRGRQEIDGLWSAIQSGDIDFVGSDDHVADATRLLAEQSDSVDFWEAESAVPGIGIGMPMFLTEGMQRGIDIRTLVRLMSESPAQAFGIGDQKGSISVGKDADITLVDLENERTVTAGDPTNLALTVAEGLRLRGWPTLTCLRGEVVFEDGAVVASGGTGRVVRGRSRKPSSALRTAR